LSNLEFVKSRVSGNLLVVHDFSLFIATLTDSNVWQ